MEDRGNKGVLSSLSPVDVPGARMGRRGSFQAIETSSINIPGVGFSSNEPQESASVDFGVKAFEFVKSIATEPTRKISSGSSKDSDDSLDSMKYKRTRARRISLISSDGLKMDFLAVCNQVDKNKLEMDLKSQAPSDVKIVIDNQQLVSVEQIQDNPPQSDTTSHNDQSLLKIVERKNIEAASGTNILHSGTHHVDDLENLPIVIHPTPEKESDHPKSFADKILNHWFFKNPDTQDEPKTSTAETMDGIGNGQLTSKVVSALSLNIDPKESRKMNMWMPQGM